MDISISSIAPTNGVAKQAFSLGHTLRVMLGLRPECSLSGTDVCTDCETLLVQLRKNPDCVSGGATTIGDLVAALENFRATEPGEYNRCEVRFEHNLDQLRQYAKQTP